MQVLRGKIFIKILQRNIKCLDSLNLCLLFYMVEQPTVGQDLLIIEATRSHSDTPPSVGLLQTGNHTVAQTSTWQHTTPTKDRRPYSRRDFNRQCH